MLAILLAALVAGLYFSSPLRDLNRYKTELVTSAGELREMPLGSHLLNINERTSLRTDQTRSGYHVTLNSGEAAFLTSKTDRPLTVSTPDVTIRGDNGLYGVRTIPGHGTDITTSRDGNDTSINCQTPDGEIKTLKLHADQSVHVGHNCAFQLGRVANIEPPELSPRTELRFRNARLVDVIGDFNTYYQHPILIEGEALSGETITGAFNPLDQHSLVEFLKNVYGVPATQATDGSLRIIADAKLTPAHAQSH